MWSAHLEVMPSRPDIAALTWPSRSSRTRRRETGASVAAKNCVSKCARGRSTSGPHKAIRSIKTRSLRSRTVRSEQLSWLDVWWPTNLDTLSCELYYSTGTRWFDTYLSLFLAKLREKPVILCHFQGRENCKISSCTCSPSALSCLLPHPFTVKEMCLKSPLRKALCWSGTWG